MADGDFICVYRQFFEEFAKDVEPNDPLPIRVASYNLSSDELVGEIIESCMQYLTEKNCPRSLLVPLTKIVMEEVTREAKKQPQHLYQPLKVMQTVTGKINEVCLRYIDNEKLSSLPAPVQETYISTHAIKHTRRKMEDRLICLPRFNTLYNVKSNTEAGYYAVFDGHNGSDAAAFSVSHLHQFLAESKYYPDDPVRAFQDAYAKTESRYKSKELRSGTTAVVILHQPAEKKLVVSWLGDSQAMLVSQGSAMMLVDPHKPEREDECQRIESLGGFVVNVDGLYRINGQLAVSRAIGDHQYKPIVSAEPDVRVVNLTGSEDFFVIGCDGLWDVVDPKDVVETVYFQVNEKPDHIETVSRRLVDLAKENGSTDNISVIVVFLTDPAEIAKRSVEASGHWPKNPFQNGVIMDANFQQAEKSLFSMPFTDPGMNGNTYEANGTHSNFNDQSKDDSDDDMGPETDVDAVDDVLVSPTKNNNFSGNNIWEKSQTEDGKMSKLIEFSNDDTLPVTDDIMNFTDDISASLKNVDGAQSNDDQYSLDLNPFNNNPFAKETENASTGDKYVEDVKLGKEEVDNFVNTNLIDHTNDLINDKNPFDQVGDKDPLDFQVKEDTGFVNENNDMFACENDSVFVNSKSDNKTDIGFDKTYVVEEETEKVSNENNEANQLNLMDNMDNFTFQANEPQIVFSSSEDVPLDASGYPPAPCSVIDVIEAQRIHLLELENNSLRDPETETPEVLSPSAPLLDGEPNEDVVVAESGGEGEESDDEDDEWNYFKGQSGVAVIEKPSDLIADAEEIGELDNQTMNSPLNPDAAEFVPVSPPPTDVDLKRTPIKNIRKDLNDIIASSPAWNNMEHIDVPEESSFLKEVKSRPSNIFEDPAVQSEPAVVTGEDLAKDFDIVELNSSNVEPEEQQQQPQQQQQQPPEISKEEIEPPCEEVRGIDLATDMTSSFIDHSTISAQSEISKQELEFILQQNEVESSVIPDDKQTSLDINAPEFKPVYEEEVQNAPPDLLSPLSLQEEVSSTSPAAETPISTLVEAPSSPRSEPVISEPAQMTPAETGPDPSPATQTPPSTPLTNEEVISRPEEITEAFEKLTVGDNPSQPVAEEAALAAVGAATIAAAIVADKKEEKKAPAKPASATKAKPATTKAPLASKTTTTAAAKKPAAATNASMAKARTTTTTTNAARPAATRVTSATKPAESKPSAPKARTPTTPSAPRTTTSRPKPTTATSITSPTSKPTTPASSRTSTATKPTAASLTRTTTPRTTSTTNATPKSTTTPKPRVPSAPVEKKPTLNGDAKPAIKRIEVTAAKKPAATTTTARTLTSRPASAPAKPPLSKTSTTATASRTTTSTARPRTTATTTTTSSRVTSTTISAAARKTVTESKVASKVTSRTSTVTKTNGVANGKVNSTMASKTTPAPIKKPTPLKTENKTEIKAESVDIVQSENEKPIENNSDGKLINGIGSE